MPLNANISSRVSVDILKKYFVSGHTMLVWYAKHTISRPCNFLSLYVEVLILKALT